MRRLRTIILTVLLLAAGTLFYLWKVEGFFSPGGSDEGKPHTPLDANADRAAWSALDTTPFEMGVAAGADASARVDPIEYLARNKPVELLREILAKYEEQGIRGYTCTLAKHERVKGKLHEPEVIECWFKEEPFSVFMHWKEGADRARASLYVAGENRNMMCVRPKLGGFVVGYVDRAPDSADARESTRYLITEFGLRCGTERTYRAWKKLQERGETLRTEYLGRRNVPEAGARDCHVLVRHCSEREDDGMTKLTVYIDAETWQQVGTVLEANGELIGSYFFRDIVVNPEFDAKRFKPETLKKY
jgi:hypothetical protein